MNRRLKAFFALVFWPFLAVAYVLLAGCISFKDFWYSGGREDLVGEARILFGVSRLGGAIDSSGESK